MTKTKAHRIGSLSFCPCCDTLLDLPGDLEIITCAQCGHQENAEDYENVVIKTSSHPDAFPSALRAKRALVATKQAHEIITQWDPIQQECAQCDSKEMLTFSIQTRSADEGATTFFRCPQCGYNYKVDN